MHNFHLTWANFPDPDSTKSPCIDAGNPAFALDPDSTFTDMGAFFFDQRVPDIELSTSQLDFGDVAIGDSADLPIVIYNLGQGNLLLFDFYNSLTEFTNNWNPSDSLILPGDSLEVMVTFAPDDAVSYSDTLWIDNNDTLCYIALTGEGQPSGIADGLSKIPIRFSLGPVLPNPCKSMAKIQFGLSAAGKANLSIYDVCGRMVSTLINGQYESGIHETSFDASSLSSGVYFCRLEASEFTAIEKVVVTK